MAAGSPDSQAAARVAGWLAAAERICVSTGAGMSAESGVPTFRDPQTGLWSKFNPQELATPEAFARDPRRVWAWYRQRRAALKRVDPAVVERYARSPQLQIEAVRNYLYRMDQPPPPR